MAGHGGGRRAGVAALIAVLAAVIIAVVIVTVSGRDGGTQPGAAPPAPWRQVRIKGVPVLADHVAPPGTPLHDGLVVPQGTHLLGQVLPLPSEAGGGVDGSGTLGTSWSAVLVVTGSVAGAIVDLAAQLDARGAMVQTRCDRHVSSPDVGEQTSCHLAAEVPHDGSGPSFVGAEAVRAPGRPVMGTQVGLARASHLVVRWGYGPHGRETAGATTDGVGIERRADVALPTGWPRLPGPGELLHREATSPSGDDDVLRLGPGLALVGPETSGIFGVTMFVIAVRGDPVAATRRLLGPVVEAHRRTGTAEMAPLETATVAGRTVHRLTVLYDLSRFIADIVVRPGHPTYVLLQHHFLD